MEIQKWDFKVDGYHPHEPGLRKKLTGLGFGKILLKEIQPGKELASKNASTEDQVLAVLGGRLFLQVVQQETQALHQGDILILPPGMDYRFKASGSVPTKVLLGRKG